MFWTCSTIHVGDAALQPGQPQFIGIKRFSLKILVVVVAVVVLIAWDAVTVTVTVTVTVAVVVKVIAQDRRSNNLWQSSSFWQQMKIESSSPHYLKVLLPLPLLSSFHCALAKMYVKFLHFETVESRRFAF